MEYQDQMQSSLSSLTEAGEAGRKSLDGMLAPMNGAISSMNGAATELESLPFVGAAIGEELQRTMRGVNAAQTQVNQVAAIYSQTTQTAAQVQACIDSMAEQAARAGAEINRLAGKLSPQLANLLPTGSLASEATPAPEAVKAFPHLLIIQPHRPEDQAYYFNLDSLAFDELHRQTAFRWAGQERLGRSIAQQAVGLGEDKLSLKGAVFPLFRGGIKQLEKIRSIGRALQPLSLTTGYGEVLGDWCLLSVSEDQSSLLAGGAPRKQAFSLEFVAYGHDMQNL